MKYDFIFSVPQKKEIETSFGLEENGRVQKVIDSSFMFFMDKKMPVKNKDLINSMYRDTKVGSGLIEVNKIYAHYQNEGIVYVDPVFNCAAFPIIKKSKDGPEILEGFYSRPGVKKNASDKRFKTSGNSNRGPHFVERTISENYNDILNIAQKEVSR